MRSTRALAFAFCLIAVAPPSLAVRAIASATIVAPVEVAPVAPSGSQAMVSVTTVRDGAFAHVTIAFN